MYEDKNRVDDVNPYGRALSDSRTVNLIRRRAAPLRARSPPAARLPPSTAPPLTHPVLAALTMQSPRNGTTEPSLTTIRPPRGRRRRHRVLSASPWSWAAACGEAPRKSPPGAPPGTDNQSSRPKYVRQDAISCSSTSSAIGNSRCSAVSATLRRHILSRSCRMLRQCPRPMDSHRCL